MKRRGGNGGVSADLLVCLPSRGRLALTPKPICSPSRSSEAQKRHQLRSASRGRGSPMFRTNDGNAMMNAAGETISEEPSSPKVTCSGQIKVSRPKLTADSRGRSWQAVIEEVEKTHGRRRHGKARRWPQWTEAFFLFNAFRGFRFRLGCFGTSAEEEEEEEDDGDDGGEGERSGATQTAFSKWFMVLEESQNHHSRDKNIFDVEEEEDDGDEERDCAGTASPPAAAPPPNALLLTRCRSTPGSRREGSGGEKKRVVMKRQATNFLEVSSDIAKETWVVGSFDLARSRSWKR
ncbi:unnamed protein product [Spirodela intermedia]|uniref:Uncharacterized protein n=1 Tax=Spirodela intermedia TaxID=51605 RepID=A0A7I8ILK6_SPIIN|nr:unnamed protein product [Spirodela intermedia]CAA6658816.1 unnamed protein product [Spirodela intermedia]